MASGLITKIKNTTMKFNDFKEQDRTIVELKGGNWYGSLDDDSIIFRCVIVSGSDTGYGYNGSIFSSLTIWNSYHKPASKEERPYFLLSNERALEMLVSLAISEKGYPEHGYYHLLSVEKNSELYLDGNMILDGHGNWALL